jgi:hypothetical protein
MKLFRSVSSEGVFILADLPKGECVSKRHLLACCDRGPVSVGETRARDRCPTLTGGLATIGVAVDLTRRFGTLAPLEILHQGQLVLFRRQRATTATIMGHEKCEDSEENHTRR